MQKKRFLILFVLLGGGAIIFLKVSNLPVLSHNDFLKEISVYDSYIEELRNCQIDCKNHDSSGSCRLNGCVKQISHEVCTIGSDDYRCGTFFIDSQVRNRANELKLNLLYVTLGGIDGTIYFAIKNNEGGNSNLRYTHIAGGKSRDFLKQKEGYRYVNDHWVVKGRWKIFDR